MSPSQFVILLLLCEAWIAWSQKPTPPTGFPNTWHTWVVTSVKKGDTIIYDKGQIFNFDMNSKYSCRYKQEDLVNPSPGRPSDYCAYFDNKHYSLGLDGNCSITPLQTNLSTITYNPNITKVAQYLGIDLVDYINCHHFYSHNVYNPINGGVVDVDIWGRVENTMWPCALTVTNVRENITYTWAFDGFTSTVPDTNNVNYTTCVQPKQTCVEQDFVCHAKANVDIGQLGGALAWVCNPSILDCTPINPGGSHWEPNTLVDHCNWAFNAYYQLHKAQQGAAACNFGGVAELVPPTTVKLYDVPQPPFFTLDLIC